jgi:hypothetical protein
MENGNFNHLGIRCTYGIFYHLFIIELWQHIERRHFSINPDKQFPNSKFFGSVHE